MQNCEITIQTGNGNLIAKQSGTATIYLYDEDVNLVKIQLPGALYVPECPFNIISTGVLQHHEKRADFIGMRGSNTIMRIQNELTGRDVQLTAVIHELLEFFEAVTPQTELKQHQLRNNEQNLCFLKEQECTNITFV